MKCFFKWTYGLVAGALIAVPSGAAAQFVAAANQVPAYQPAGAGYQAAAPSGYTAAMAQPTVVPPAYGTVQPGTVPAIAGYTAPAPTGQPYAAPGYGAPAYAVPRVAQATELPAPAEAVGAAAPAMAPAAMAPVQSATAPMSTHTQPMSHVQPAYPAVSSSCATGDCGSSAPVSAPVHYQSGPVQHYAPAPSDVCGTQCVTPSYSAPACDLGVAPVGPRGQWFGGLYGLYLERDNPGKATAAFLVEDVTSITTPYYPPNSAQFLTSTSAGAEADGQFGGEIRFGRTFGHDPCSCSPRFAWEVGYWGIEEDQGQSTLLNTTALGVGNTLRIYGAINFAGLEYDRDGAGTTYGYRPLNDYYDYQIPVENAAPNDIRVVGQRVRTSFSAQNLELNFWRFGTTTQAASLGGAGLLNRARHAAGGIGACGYDTCGAGSCGLQACAPCRPPRRFTLNGLLGVRYFRMDESFQNAIQFSAGTPGGTADDFTPNTGEPTAYTSFPLDDDNVLFYDIEADNQLVGFQLGCSMNWLVGSKWNLFADSSFGIYGNDIEIYQRAYSGGGGVVRFVDDGSTATIRTSRTNFSTLGDLRIGAGYRVSCNCRLTAAYRLLAVSGVALTTDQIPSFANSSQASHVNSNGSLILHGLQTGVEFKY